MKEEQYDFITSDFVDGIPSGSVEPEYEYWEIELSREQFAELFIKVPKGFDGKSLKIKDIATFYDKQDPEWECIDGWEWNLSKKVDEKTAICCGYSELKNS